VSTLPISIKKSTGILKIFSLDVPEARRPIGVNSLVYLPGPDPRSGGIVFGENEKTPEVIRGLLGVSG
jgi:hypothetical protein